MNTNHFFLHLKSTIQTAELLVNTHTQSIVPKGQQGLKLDVMVNQSVIRFDSKGIPPSIWKNIQTDTKCTLTYNIPVSNELIRRPVSFVIAVQDACSVAVVQEINQYVRQSLTWLYIAQKNAKKNQCNTAPLIVYLLFSPLLKMLPIKGTKGTALPVIDWVNANTAFTMVCQDLGRGVSQGQSGAKSRGASNPKVREIVIYRKEEWFKVFIHETFHNYGFDFSNASDDLIQYGTSFVLNKLYPVKSDVNLYEAYTECWARIIYVAFSCMHTGNDDAFLACMKRRLDEEIAFSFFQAAKVLEYMNIESYEQLVRGQCQAEYKENTSILAYYVITLVLFANYPAFIAWCYQHNRITTTSSSLQFHLSDYIVFKQTRANLESFCTALLQKQYQASNLVQKINHHLADIRTKKRKTALYKTLRMTSK